MQIFRFPFKRLRNANIKQSEFDDVKRAKTRFHDCYLKKSVFNDVDLDDAEFLDVSLKNVRITQANLQEMMKNGVLVSDLFDAYHTLKNTPQTPAE